MIYLNGRKGRQQAEVALQTGSAKGSDVVVIVEALIVQERRPTHSTCDLVWNSKYMAVYVSNDNDIRVKAKRIGTDRRQHGSGVPTTTQKPTRSEKNIRKDRERVGQSNGRFELLRRVEEKRVRRMDRRRRLTGYRERSAYTHLGQA